MGASGSGGKAGGSWGGSEVVRTVPGSPSPLGATCDEEGVNFSIVSGRASSCTLVLFDRSRGFEPLEIPLDRQRNRTGDVWHIRVLGAGEGVEYAFRLDRSSNPEPHLDRFQPFTVLCDPYSRALSRSSPGQGFARRSLVADQPFDWEGDRPPRHPLEELIIYEAHVRGFTRHPSSGVDHPGTFGGLIHKIPYLQDLGINALELLPVTDFEPHQNRRHNPFTGEPLTNYWGYDPIGFFALHPRYASRRDPCSAIQEFKTLVKELHRGGIEVILDMVFNHTAEEDEGGPTYSFRGIDNRTYYLLDSDTGEYLDFSGCGNTLNCNHPVVRRLILDSLRYWVEEMHVDGFRFDLASILTRGQDGAVLDDPPLLRDIAEDPALRDVKLIAEPWDASGLYQAGKFLHRSRFAEWNGEFRDDLRRFAIGVPGLTRKLATRLIGSPDLFGTNRTPGHSVNFVTSHDGFTLRDLVSYNQKHNLANGELGRDGADNNHSWNCGEEGTSVSARVNSLRARQMRNLAALLLLSQGIPMFPAGDEMGRTQGGNNNPYCQDNLVSWVDWTLLDINQSLYRFFRRLIRFRRVSPLLRSRFFPQQGDGSLQVSWHGVLTGRPDWSSESRRLAMHLSDDAGSHLYLIANAHWEGHRFELPRLTSGRRWRRFLDTALEPPDEICEPGQEGNLDEAGAYPVKGRSVVALVSFPKV